MNESSYNKISRSMLLATSIFVTVDMLISLAGIVLIVAFPEKKFFILLAFFIEFFMATLIKTFIFSLKNEKVYECNVCHAKYATTLKFCPSCGQKTGKNNKPGELHESDLLEEIDVFVNKNTENEFPDETIEDSEEDMKAMKKALNAMDKKYSNDTFFE